jgi:hypothetical protein
MDEKHQEAERILFGDQDLEYDGGIERFEYGDNVSLDDIKELVLIDYLDEKNSHNKAPTVKEFIDLGSFLRYKNIDPHYIGYIYHPDRDDSTDNGGITGVEAKGIITDEVSEKLREYNGGADDYLVKDDWFRLWWD